MVQLPVRDVMTPDVITVRDDASCDDVAAVLDRSASRDRHE